MSPTPHQLSFEGREVSGSKLNIPGGLGEVDFESDDGLKLEDGDEVEMTIRFVVEDVHHPEKHDRDGVATDTIRRVHDLKMLRRGWAITEIVRREAKEAAYREKLARGA